MLFNSFWYLNSKLEHVFLCTESCVCVTKIDHYESVLHSSRVCNESRCVLWRSVSPPVIVRVQRRPVQDGSFRISLAKSPSSSTRTYSSPASDSQRRRHPSTRGRSDWLTNRQPAGVWAPAIWKRKQSELKVFCSLIGQLTGTYQNAAGTVLFFIFLSAFIGLFVFFIWIF